MLELLNVRKPTQRRDEQMERLIEGHNLMRELYASQVQETVD
jgi:hypothetical protein